MENELLGIIAKYIVLDAHKKGYNIGDDLKRIDELCKPQPKPVVRENPTTEKPPVKKPQTRRTNNGKTN